VFDLDVDVGREAHVVGRDRIHVEDEAADSAETYYCPPTFLYWPYQHMHIKH